MNEKRYARITPQAIMKDFPMGTKINFGSAIVDGYLFDGKYWYPAYSTWDGWCPYFGDENDLYEPLQNSDEDLMWMMNI